MAPPWGKSAGEAALGLALDVRRPVCAGLPWWDASKPEVVGAARIAVEAAVKFPAESGRR
jgi:hypothetical protein